MNIGNLYLVKKCWYWLLFPTKEVAVAIAATHNATSPVTSTYARCAAAAYWSKRFNCEVTYFSPDSYIVFLEEEGKYKRVLTADGKVGWTAFEDYYSDCFEEVNI